MKDLTMKILVLATLASLTGCTATQHLDDVRGEEIDRVTVGTVQKEITLGMSATEVATVLGSPNIVTSASDRNETWIYDKISSEVSYSRSSGGIIGLIFGSSAGVGAGGSVGSGATATSQRTLTVIIRFDSDSQVRDFSYHSSRF